MHWGRTSLQKLFFVRVTLSRSIFGVRSCPSASSSYYPRRLLVLPDSDLEVSRATRAHPLQLPPSLHILIQELLVPIWPGLDLYIHSWDFGAALPQLSHLQHGLPVFL